MNDLDEKTLNAAWDILIAEAGASTTKREREQFVSYFLTAQNPEWRFMGKLGSGGKARFNGANLYVTCYCEQETPERLAIIEKVNEKLAALKPHQKKLWIWNWIGGGYNSCYADTKEDVLAEASRVKGQSILVVDEASIRIGTQAELNKLDKEYARDFD